MYANVKGTTMSEFITKAHYPTIDIKTILEEHKSSYGLCTECSTFSTLVSYPCAIVKEITNG
jgi:hypothetical protein